MSGSVRGFTLVEMLVVLALMAGLVALVPGAYGKLQESMAWRAAVKEVHAAIRDARQEAMHTGVPTAFEVLPATGAFRVENLRGERLPESTRVEMQVAAEFMREDWGRIVFYPDGSASGGTLILWRARGDGVFFEVDWLLGRVTHGSVTETEGT
ncbi:MAG: GspH/FimT family pseudopilin [Halothiobacillaceae bacterium]